MAYRAARRAVTIPALAAAAVVAPLALIAVTLVTAPVSLATRGRWRAVRLGCFAVAYLGLEVVALVQALGVWLRAGPASRRDPARYARANLRLIEVMLGRLYAAARRLFGLRAQVLPPPGHQAGAAGIPAGPVIVLSRHAGPGDAFLLIYALLACGQRHPRIVLKNTLALDPWLDVLLGRIPHVFVRPSAPGHQATADIAGLAAGMGDGDALVIFPEGGNFTTARRQRAISRLRRRGLRRRAAQAARLEHVLPPHPAGALAAMAACPGARVLTVAHTGLDHIDSAAALWRGIPLHQPLVATWWETPVSDLPDAEDPRADWLYQQWVKVDDWISAQAPASPAASVR